MYLVLDRTQGGDLVHIHRHSLLFMPSMNCPQTQPRQSNIAHLIPPARPPRIKPPACFKLVRVEVREKVVYVMGLAPCQSVGELLLRLFGVKATRT